jgi:hypothetical protein
MQMLMSVMVSLTPMLCLMHFTLLHMLMLMMLAPIDAKMLNVARHLAGAYTVVVVA